MKLDHLSDDELLHYLDKHNTDPVMKRVVDILLDKQQGIISDLVAAGMDPQYWTFTSDNYNHYYPGQFVSHLRNEIDYIENDLADTQAELERAHQEINRLKARTVAQLILELNQDIANMNSDLILARQERDQAIIKEKRTMEKMKVWTAMSTDMSR